METKKNERLEEIEIDVVRHEMKKYEVPILYCKTQKMKTKKHTIL